MKALDLLKTILENGLSSYNEEDDTVLVNGWWVTLEECIAELEALQQPKSCYDCKHWFPNKASYPCNQCSMAINCLFEPKEQ